MSSNLINNEKTSNRILFTTLEYEPYTNYESYNYSYHSSAEDFLIDLIIYALQYEEILIKDLDLVLNDKIIFYLTSNKNITFFFEELLKRGIVKIVLSRPETYSRDDDIVRMAEYAPILARAEFNRKHTGRAAKEFVIKGYMHHFYTKLDFIINEYQNIASVPQPFPGLPKAFEKTFRNIITSTTPEMWIDFEFKESWEHDGLNILKELQYYKSDIQNALKLLHDKFPKDKKMYENELTFSRNLLYWCLKLEEFNYDQTYQMRKLIQSVFASKYCNFMNSHGRFSNIILPEPPFFMSQGDDHKRGEKFRSRSKASVIPINCAQMNLIDALVEARKTTLLMFNTQDKKEIERQKDAAIDIFKSYYIDPSTISDKEQLKIATVDFKNEVINVFTYGVFNVAKILKKHILWALKRRRSDDPFEIELDNHAEDIIITDRGTADPTSDDI